MKIIIPSALLIPEGLQNLGKMPAIVYPVEGKMVFQYLYKLYGGSCSSFKVVCGKRAEQVHDCLESYENVLFEDIPELEIKDLGYTVYRGIQHEKEPVVINFGDTIVEENIIQEDTDAYFYSEDTISEKWTFFEEHDGRIMSICDKTGTKHSGRGKLFVGVFLITDTVLFCKCLEEAFSADDRRESTFYYALRKYSEVRPMKPVYTEEWFDIGHLDKYYHSKMEVSAREFNHISIDRNRGILKKTSDNVGKFIDEIKWYLKLPGDIEYVRPRIFAYSTAYEKPYISMEYYAYHTLHELFLYSDLNVQQWNDIFNRIKFVINDFKRYTVKDNRIRVSLEEMYLKKTLQRFDTLRLDERFKFFFEKPVIVNGKRYRSLNKIAELLKEVIPVYLYDIDNFSIIHGDLCFSNILVDSNLFFVKVVDPRGKFGAFDIYGDKRYELAKLFHSVDGKYDYIIKDLFEVSYDAKKAEITYSISERKMDFSLYEVFREAFQDDIGDDIKKIELIEALLFLSMIPLHNESFKHQIVMLGTGLNILDRIVDITEKRKKDV